MSHPSLDAASASRAHSSQPGEHGRGHSHGLIDPSIKRSRDVVLGDALTAVPLGAAFLVRSDRTERGAGVPVVLTILASAITAGVFAILRIIHPLSPGHLLLGLAGAGGVAGNAVAARVRLDGGRRLISPALLADGQHRART